MFDAVQKQTAQPPDPAILNAWQAPSAPSAPSSGWQGPPITVRVVQLCGFARVSGRFPGQYHAPPPPGGRTNLE